MKNQKFFQTLCLSMAFFCSLAWSTCSQCPSGANVCPKCVPDASASSFGSSYIPDSSGTSGSSDFCEHQDTGACSCYAQEYDSTLSSLPSLPFFLEALREAEAPSAASLSTVDSSLTSSGTELSTLSIHRPLIIPDIMGSGALTPALDQSLATSTSFSSAEEQSE